ncbi:hypothetical protein MMC28_009747 [Mycoblastus sanguinarius]|nr:hypothetical protein [Mycoblastus sanguinarius]
MAEESRGYALDIPHKEDYFAPSVRDDGFEICTFGDEVRDLRDGRTPLAGDIPHASKSLEPYSTSETAKTFGGEHLDFSTCLETSNAALPGAEEGLKPFVDTQCPIDLEPFIHDYRWSLEHQMQSLETHNSTNSSTSEASQGQNTSLCEKEALALLEPSEVRMGEASNMEIGEAGTDSSVKLIGTERIIYPQPKAGDKIKWEGSSVLHPMTSNSASSQIQEGNEEPSPACSSLTQDLQLRRMQELSVLAMTCYSQVMEFASRDEANPLALNMPNNLAGKVLESSVKFLGLLTSLYPPRPPSPIRTSHPSSSDEETSTLEASDDNIRTTHDRSQGSHQLKPSSSTYNCNSDDLSPQPVDMTEVFALLTCYLRILHLHSLLYSRFSDYLTTLFQKGAPLPPVFPGMQAGGVSLDDFGKLQVKFLIHISTHVLGEIEMALGLPDGYRISKKRMSQGILDGSTSMAFIELAMKEKSKTGLGIERDKFRSIRTNLGNLRQLLKGTINA